MSATEASGSGMQEQRPTLLAALRDGLGELIWTVDLTRPEEFLQASDCPQPPITSFIYNRHLSDETKSKVVQRIRLLLDDSEADGWQQNLKRPKSDDWKNMRETMKNPPIATGKAMITKKNASSKWLLEWLSRKADSLGPLTDGETGETLWKALGKDTDKFTKAKTFAQRNFPPLHGQTLLNSSVLENTPLYERIRTGPMIHTFLWGYDASENARATHRGPPHESIIRSDCPSEPFLTRLESLLGDDTWTGDLSDHDKSLLHNLRLTLIRPAMENGEDLEEKQDAITMNILAWIAYKSDKMGPLVAGETGKALWDSLGPSKLEFQSALKANNKPGLRVFSTFSSRALLPEEEQRDHQYSFVPPSQ